MSTSSIGNFLFLNSNTSLICSIWIVFKFKDIIIGKPNSSLVWLSNREHVNIRTHLFCSIVIDFRLFKVVNVQTEQPYNKCE